MPVVRDEERDLIARLEERVNALYRLLDEREKQVQLAVASIDRATNKAEEAQTRVNTTQNEFRGALKDQATMLATKDQVERIEERLLSLEKSNSSFAGKSSGSGTTMAVVFTVGSLLIGAAALAASLWSRQ